ncbi:hypothetical protein [Campylobacter sp. RM12651]|uniref:hypothetical protein n=1 Tax=Campylobacter sp. RM12651 TaxID=1660079 RepID=UPI001EFA9AE9|nr:hypothetical protein [Campylobacter sp. RM12651]ULO03743.1 hypothetical protein AVBRAN_1288 [Campylobacter sp. RM12651]
MSIIIQITLKSENAINIAKKLGKHKRIYIEQAIIEYAKILENEGKLDIFFQNCNSLEDLLKKPSLKVDKKTKTNQNNLYKAEEYFETEQKSEKIVENNPEEQLKFGMDF